MTGESSDQTGYLKFMFLHLFLRKNHQRAMDSMQLNGCHRLVMIIAEAPPTQHMQRPEHPPSPGGAKDLRPLVLRCLILFLLGLTPL